MQDILPAVNRMLNGVRVFDLLLLPLSSVDSCDGLTFSEVLIEMSLPIPLSFTESLSSKSSYEESDGGLKHLSDSDTSFCSRWI